MTGLREDPAREARQHWSPLREDCVCGVSIVATTFLADDVIDAVRRHQIEPVHLAYDIDHNIPLASWQTAAFATLTRNGWRR